MYKLEFKGKCVEFNECPEDDEKYIVFTCAKDEDDYVVEWVEYHLGIGFDKIIICDNNDDNTILPELLSEHIKNGTVEIFDVSDYQKVQTSVFNMFATQGHYKWCAFIDGDEFIEISGRYADVKEMLNDCDAECLCLNWMVYGTNGNIKKEKAPVQERFPKPLCPIVYLKENAYVKSILRKTDNPNLVYSNPHYPMGCKTYNYGLEKTVTIDSGMFNYPFYYKNAYIRHYLSKSEEEYKAKQKRGWSDCDDSILREGSHIDLLKQTVSIPVNYMSEGLFDKRVPCHVRNSVGKYDVYVVKRKHKEYGFYILNLLIGTIFEKTEGVTIVLDKDVDNVLYQHFLEAAIQTNNRVIACDGNKEKYDEIFKRFHKKWNDDYMFLILP